MVLKQGKNNNNNKKTPKTTSDFSLLSFENPGKQGSLVSSVEVGLNLLSGLPGLPFA